MESHCLTIVIPALNEEEAIGGTIERCLDARDSIMHDSPVREVEIVVVSDGSTDRTAEIARSYDQVTVIEFAKNRGYGAAIQAGWQRGTGTLLGFLDADGTCDPQFFGELCRACLDGGADLALGSRMGPQSQMPRIRRLGNRFYVLLLGFLCGEQVTDTASGMRVVRRSALPQLLPLPNGLHFTPSMSARAMLNNLRVAQLPMSYAERIGESKLNVVKDGVRFLMTIMDAVLCYRPEKLFLLMFCACAALMLVLGMSPTEFYLRNWRLEEWMIYRFVACQLLGSFGLLLLLAAALANRLAGLGSRQGRTSRFWPSVVTSLFSGWTLVAIMVALLSGAIFFLRPGIWEFVSTGTVTLHWSRLLAGAFCLFSLMQTCVFGVLCKMAAIWQLERTALAPSAGVEMARPQIRSKVLEVAASMQAAPLSSRN